MYLTTKSKIISNLSLCKMKLFEKSANLYTVVDPKQDICLTIYSNTFKSLCESCLILF